MFPVQFWIKVVEEKISFLHNLWPSYFSFSCFSHALGVINTDNGGWPERYFAIKTLSICNYMNPRVTDKEEEDVLSVVDC